MQAAEHLTNWIAGIEAYSQSKQIPVPVSDVVAGALRLDAGLYASEGYQARHDFENSKLKKITLQEACSEIFDPPLFKRTYTDKEFGVPYINSSEMQEARPDLTKRYISKDTKNLDLYIIKEQDILITAAGTVGNVVFATADLNGAAGTSDIMRLRAYEDYTGTVYSALMSPYGQFLLTGYQYGSVVQRIRAHQIGQMIIPLFPKKLRDELTRLILETCSLRVKANKLLTRAEMELQESCNLPEIRDIKPNNLIKSNSESMIFACKLSKALTLGAEFNTLRMDSTFYNPVAFVIREQIKKKKWTTVEKGSEDVILLGKTFVPGVHKVEKEFGIPYFTGKELSKFRQSPETFITSQNRPFLKKLTVNAGTILITCAGTVGKVMYVSGQLENAAITHDAIRVIPSKNKLHAGYIYAFLASAYGKSQLDQCSYGSVIPRLYSSHIKNIILPIPDDTGSSIGEKVDQAFKCRSNAFGKEEKAIRLFLEAIEMGKDAVESKWGRAY